MSRWEVKQHIYSRKWLAYPKDYRSLRPQTVVDASVPCVHMFHRHAEALAYADRMARTREVVLPRFTFDALDNWKTVPGTQNVFLGLYYREAPVIGEVEYELGVTDCETTYLNPRDARPLALALLALAEQEEHE